MAQNLADSMVNLSSSDADVLVTVDQVEESSNGNIPNEPMVVVNKTTPDVLSGSECALSEVGTTDNQTSSLSSVKGAEGGEVLDNTNLEEVMVAGGESNKKAEAQTRGSPTNPMSVSVPNLPTSMEQTVSLLETFAAVARRNLGIVGKNNRSNSIRLVPNNSPSKFTY